MKAILLAAGRGKRFGNRTRLVPKCLVTLDKNGQTLFERYLQAFVRLGIRDAVVVVGHLAGQIRRASRPFQGSLNIRFVHNDRYRLGSIVSLYAARAHMNSPCLIMDADVFFPDRVLKKLLLAPHASAFLMDSRSKSTGEEMMLMARDGKVALIRKRLEKGLKILGEATGIVKLSRSDAQLLTKILKKMVTKGIVRAEYEEAYCELMRHRRLKTVNVGNVFWSEMDFESDLRKIRAYVKKGGA